MKTLRHPLMMAASLAAALALAGCGKKDDAASQIPSTLPPEVAAPATPPATTTAAPESGEAMLSVSSVQLGSKVDENHKITVSGDAFAPKDSIYASVDTRGNGHGTLAAKWTYQDGQTMHEDSKMLDGGGPETTVFVISRPSGFPAGSYKVQISLDGAQAASKDFSVR